FKLPLARMQAVLEWLEQQPAESIPEFMQQSEKQHQLGRKLALLEAMSAYATQPEGHRQSLVSYFAGTRPASQGYGQPREQAAVKALGEGAVPRPLTASESWLLDHLPDIAEPPFLHPAEPPALDPWREADLTRLLEAWQVRGWLDRHQRLTRLGKTQLHA
ncbi:MAG: hypothetical protein AAF708_11065, partial [Deinococcota bacterium]